MNKPNFTFVDLFAGIGGFHLAAKNLGMRCEFANDYNKFSCKTYQANHGEIKYADLAKINGDDLPSFDFLFGGFPCQPFSIAGVSKKKSLGLKHGFEDEKQGNLFFEILRLIDQKRPKVLFLENVKNLKSHDKGNTWKVIHDELVKRNYSVFFDVINGCNYVPQNRERVFIVCFDNNLYPSIDFHFPEMPKRRYFELADVLEKDVDEKYTLSDKLWLYLQRHKENSAKKGNGFGYGLIDEESTHTRTLSARYYKDGSEILIKQKNKNPRRLTPRECARLQGFPDNFLIPVSDNQAYRQFGNSVVVPAVQDTLLAILRTLEDYAKGNARKFDLFNYMKMK